MAIASWAESNMACPNCGSVRSIRQSTLGERSSYTKYLKTMGSGEKILKFKQLSKEIFVWPLINQK